MAGGASCEFMQALFTILFYIATKGGFLITFLVCLAYMFFFPVSMIGMGVAYKDSCPVQPYLPIYLILYGAFAFVRNICGSTQQNKRKLITEPLYDRIIDGFMMILFLLGTFWVFRIYPPNYNDTKSANYCSEYLYKFALAHLLIYYSWLALRGFFCTCGANTVVDYKINLPLSEYD